MPWLRGVVCALLCGAAEITCVCGIAQDTRTVAQPKIPATCIKLEATKVYTGALWDMAIEAREDTVPIQAAIDSLVTKCQQGEAVELALAGKAGPKGANAFLSGPIELKEGVTLLIDKGVTLVASRNPADYDMNGAGTCGTIPSRGPCKAFITIRAKNVGIMGDGVIDGRGGAKLLGQEISWWGLAVKGEPTADQPAGIPYSDPRLISATNADNLTIYRITLHDSPNFHVGVSRTNGFTAWGVHLKTPVHDPGPNDPRPRNTDGIDPGASSNVTIIHSWIDNGDDNVAIKTGTTHISVIDDHFYSGHGMSIGSETNTGVSYLLVDGIVEDHTTSGVRIKSNATRGGLVENLMYRNICMRSVPVPIAISPYYNNQTTEDFVDPGIKGDRIPEYRNITLENITDTTPGDVLIAGYDQDHRTKVTLNNVTIEGETPDKIHLRLADITTIRTNLPLVQAAAGNDVTITKIPNDIKISRNPLQETGPYACTWKFIPMQ